MKRCITFILVLFIGLFVACHASPSTDIVVNRGDGKLEMIIAAEPLLDQNFTVSSPWAEYYSFLDRECHINATIRTPDSNKYPVTKIAKKNLNYHISRALLNILLKTQ